MENPLIPEFSRTVVAVPHSRFGWVSIVVAVFALIVSCVAYARAEMSANRVVIEQYAESIDRLNIKIARLNAIAELAVIDVEHNTLRNEPRFAGQISAVHKNLAGEYMRAHGEASEEWKDLESRFGELELRASSNTGSATGSLQTLIGRLGGW